MAGNKRGISRDLIIHPGETISDILEDRNMTQKELAKRLNVSEPFLSDVIRGKKDISRKLAIGLEYALGVSCSFWLNLQANYDAELMEYLEERNVLQEEVHVLSELHEVVKYLKKQSIISDGLSKEQTVIALRKYLHISNLMRLNNFVPNGLFRISQRMSVNQYVLGAWLCMCNVLHNDLRISTVFNPDRIDELVDDIKHIMMHEKNDLQKSLSDLLANHGIEFNVMQNFRGAPVQGFITEREEGKYQMVMTLRGAYADIFWFSLFHELGHIVNGDVNSTNQFIDVDCLNDSVQETRADNFARNALLDQNSYERFLKDNRFTFHDIEEYAKEQNVPSYIVIGRLQKEGIIPWNKFQKYKTKYRWAQYESE